MAGQFLAAFASQVPLTGFLVAGEQRKLDQEMQRHRNSMLEISGSVQENQLTLSEIDTEKADRRLNQDIQQRAMADQASAEVNAAAAGVAGGSVDAVMRGLKRSALNAQQARIENTGNAFQSIGTQRTNLELSQIFQTDNTVLPKPSFASLLLGMGTAAYDAYKQTTP